MESITADELLEHVKTLADDAFEGREAGSRGGRAAGVYLANHFQKQKLRGGGVGNGYFQLFGANSRNILGWIEGSDPTLKDEFVFITAHYDHVGYGNSANSNGPTGFIHNGADDNASGVAGVLEVLDAFCSLPAPPKRSVMFVLWDGEEAGLLGSKHWIAEPTVPTDKIAAVINVDMIGRLRNDRAMVYGCRTTYGLRELICRQNDTVALNLDFSWLMKAESDHYPFFAAGIPVLMLHTGLHDDYHRPSDSAEKVNSGGIQKVSRLLFRTALELADTDEKPKFRSASRRESPTTRLIRERALAPAPSRLGFSWDADDAKNGKIRLTTIAPGSAAASAGLKVGDQITHFASTELDNPDTLRRLALRSEGQVTLTVEREGESEPLELVIEPNGKPVRLGISWQVDDAEPAAVTLVRVVPGSAADAAGLKVYDRVYEVNGQRFLGSDEFLRLVTEMDSPLQMLVERRGKMQRIEVERDELISSSIPQSP